MYYENSNGFVPMIPSATPSYDPDSSSLRPNDLEDNRSERGNATNAVSARDNSRDPKDAKNLEEDLAYSSAARIFLSFPGTLTNRRSFDFQAAGLNEFELLKVNNDTPAVANYKNFYENVRDTSENSETDESSERASGQQMKKGIDHHGRGYGNPYAEYHTYDAAQDTRKKTAYEQEKVAGNYRPQDTADNDGHARSATRQNAALVSSARTNYGVIEPEDDPHHGRAYDNVAESSKTYHRFSRPVVVAEPSNYKVDVKFSSQLRATDSSNDYKTSRNLESSSSETSEAYVDDNSKQHNYNHNTGNSKNLSDESMEYTEYIERPRVRVQKIRRRPGWRDSDSTRKSLHKEHRVTTDERESAEEQDKVHKYSSSRLKPQRYRVKANPWINDPSASQLDESVEDVRHDSLRGSSGSSSSSGAGTKKVHHASRGNQHIGTTSWNHLSPNLEISHSSGIELDQVEKPKFVVPVKVNLVPVANFDHATALGNSQGFDVSNAVLQNLVTAAPVGGFSTAAPILSTPHPILAQNLALPKNLHNVQGVHGVSTSVPEVIVGQSSFQSPVHTVLLSQPSGQGKIANTLRTNYLPSTMTPVFALTSSLTPALQSLSLQNAQDNVTPRTAFAATTSAPVVQQVPLNHLHSGSVQQLIVPQPTIQTFLQAPFQTSPHYQIQVNPHGLQGQNLINHNLQVHNLPTTPTMLSGQQSDSRINLVSVDSQDKKNPYSTSGASFLASASLAVGENEQKHATNVNSYYLQPTNSQEGAYQMNVTPKTRTTFVQATQVVPTIVQPGVALAVNAQQLIPAQQNLHHAPNHLILQRPRDQQYQIKLQTASGVDNAAAQQQLSKQLAKTVNQLSGVTALQAADSTASNSNNVNNVNANLGTAATGAFAHLPNVGTKNVEILNPNIKPNPIDVNTFATMHYQPAVLTTPIPIFSTVGSISTPQTVSLQSYVNSLTESGAKGKQVGDLDPKPSQYQERPMFNPINFVPNVDVIKNQNTLNNKLPANEPVQQGLNLVPVMPGGNFFKPSYAAQNELMMKPKLASDLQKYAEEMFRESLKTMYNSQKWNNDRRQQQQQQQQPPTSQNSSETSDLAKLRLELQKLRASLLSENKYRDHLEAHQSENKVRATEFTKSGDKKKKKPEALLATLEHLMKTRPSGPIHIYHGSGRPSHKHKPSGDSSLDVNFHDDFNGASHLREYLTPPRPNSFHKSPFHDKPMKRPGSSRFKNGPRMPMRSNHSPPRSSGTLETSASNNMDHHLDASRYHGSPFDNFDNYNTRYQSSSFDAYPSFTTSPLPDALGNILRELKTSSSNKEYDINHPRMHNLLGLLMKNKRLPTRGEQNYFRDKDQLSQYFDNEKRQLRQQFYDDMKDYLDRADDVTSQQTSGSNRKAYSGNGAA